MNKKLLAYLLMLFLATGFIAIEAQTLAGDPSNSIEKGDYATEFEIVAKSNVQNTSNDRITLSWARVKNDLPDGWISLVCDPITCWGPNTSQNPDPITVDGNGLMLLDIHVQPNGIEGTGVIDIHVWAPADSANTNITMSYQIDAFSVGIEDDPVSQIKVYPNPVRNNLTLDIGLETNVRYVEVYSLIGRKMAHYTIPYSTSIYSINASALPEGLYFVKMLDQNFEQIATKSFAKD